MGSPRRPKARSSSWSRTLPSQGRNQRFESATGYLPELISNAPALARSGRGRQSLSLVVPDENARGAEGVPPARSPLALVHREVQPAGMGILKGPAAVRIALG